MIAIIIAVVCWRKRKDDATKYSVDKNPMYGDNNHYEYEGNDYGDVGYSDENYYAK